MNTWKTNLEETKKHYDDWWNHKGIILNMWEHFQENVTPHADVPMPKPYKDLNQRWFDPVWRAEYLDWYVAHSCLKADILPVANTQLGPGSLAAILGGVFEGGEDTIWIHPNPIDCDDIVFDPNHPNWLLHKDLLQACKRKAQGHYYVGMPDLMEGLDVLAALKGADRVLMDTVMRPELVERQLQQINDVYFQVFDELYDIIREGDEMAFCYFSSWAPGKMTKLQSDISTMISVDDYRRFVLPFIHEQCRKIPYTLYHLDGVGAIRHLDALLEIDELNAIQWTPGVGQPQGGSPKWYDLYRRILDTGKSVMVCWVKPDELRPLLEAIGTDGVHIEMDFHNEQEVEEAMEIVEKKKRTTTSPSLQRRREDRQTSSLPHREGLGESLLLLLDGAMGTMIQQHHLREEDYRGERFATHPIDLKGSNDVLALTAPAIVSSIHKKYLDAGSDIIETNTFNAQRISLADYGLQDYAREINLAAARLARQCADEFSSSEKPRFVAGSIGPTNRTFLSEEGKVNSEKFATALKQAYEEQIQALADGGVDALLIETIFDVENARVAIDAARKIAPQLPLMLSFSVATPDGHNMLGQNILDFLQSIISPTTNPSPLPSCVPSVASDQRSSGGGSGLFSIGINCVTDVAQMAPLVKELARFGTRVSFYPNAGLPDANGHYLKTPESLLRNLWPLLEGHHLNIVGGCCGTTDKHIALMAKAIEPVPGIRLSPLTQRASNTSYTSNTSSTSHVRKEATASSGFSLFDAIIAGETDAAITTTKEAIAAGAEPQTLINEQMIGAMSEIGRQFQEGKAFVPQLLMAGRAMKSALKELQPLMAGTTRTSLGKVVIGTVKGDLHDIGKNLVASMLEGCGFEVINIGIDVSADKFIEAVRKHEADILCMSALLTTTMDYMKDVISALEAAGLRKKVKVMVGGAPVTQGFANEIGADGYADNANSAVAVAKQLLEMRAVK